MADDDQDPSDSVHFLFPIEPHHRDSVSPWSDSDDDHDFNPFASTSFAHSPARRSSGGDWLFDSDDSDPDRDMSSFVTDLFERGGGSPELTPEGIGGLRIAEFDSESDYDDGGGDVRVRVRDSPVEEEEEAAFEWEEVSEERGSLEVVEVTPETETEIETEFYEMALEAVQSFEWEIMMAINTLAANVSLERDNAGAGGDTDGYVYAIGGGEYDAVFEQFVESENALKGSPPAAKSFVEGLPPLEAAAVEELGGKDGAACAVCKDRISAGETVKMLPCCHYYHSDCIVPWLGIRNTCPVCRHEVPTDDPDYERRRAGGGQRRNSQVVFNI